VNIKFKKEHIAKELMRKQGGLRPTSLNSQILDRDNSKSLIEEIERSKSADINQFSVKDFAGSSLFKTFESISEGDDSDDSNNKDKDGKSSSSDDKSDDDSDDSCSGSDEEKQAEQLMKQATKSKPKSKDTIAGLQDSICAGTGGSLKKGDDKDNDPVKLVDDNMKFLLQACMKLKKP